MTAIPIQLVEVDAGDHSRIVADWRVQQWPCAPRVGEYVSVDVGDDETEDIQRFRVVGVEHAVMPERDAAGRIAPGARMAHDGVTVYMTHDPDPSIEPVDQ